MTQVFLRPEAELDVRAIARWYEEESAGLGDELSARLGETFAKIAALPSRFPRVTGAAQRALLRKFPYAGYSLVEDDRVVVVGVFHQHRDPMVWRDRL